MEQDLWQALKDALALPQSADLKRLCHLFDWAIAQLPESQQLDAAGKAIEQIAAVYALKADCLLASWEATHEASEPSLPVLNTGVLDGWIRQSMSLDLDLFVEQPVSKRSRRNHQPQANASIAAVVDQASLLEMLDQIAAEPDPDQMMRQLAGEEDPVKWSMAIARWMEEHSLNQSIRIDKLRFSLGMPWVEVWMGLLLGIGFCLEQTGDFYSNEIWIRYQPTQDRSS